MFLPPSPPASRLDGPPELSPEPATNIQSRSVRSTNVVGSSPNPPLIDAGKPEAATDDLLSDLGGGGLRVIQAQLLTSYTKYKRYKVLVEKRAIPVELLLEVTERPRILVAHLREMEDEAEAEKASYESLRRVGDRGEEGS